MIARLAATAVVALGALCGSAAAAEGVAATDAWARAGAPAAKAGAAFLTLTNQGSAADRLVAAESPVADKTELHTHLMDSGVMKMRPVDAIELPPGSPVMLKPGGLHVMFLGLKQPLTEGAHFPVTLVFEKAGRVTVDVTVQGAAAMGPGGMGAGGMGQGHMGQGPMGQGHMNPGHMGQGGMMSQPPAGTPQKQ